MQSRILPKFDSQTNLLRNAETSGIRYKRQIRGFSEENCQTPTKTKLHAGVSGELGASPADLSRPSNFEGVSGVKHEKVEYIN